MYGAMVEHTIERRKRNRVYIQHTTGFTDNPKILDILIHTDTEHTSIHSR